MLDVAHKLERSETIRTTSFTRIELRMALNGDDKRLTGVCKSNPEKFEQPLLLRA